MCVIVAGRGDACVICKDCYGVGEENLVVPENLASPNTGSLPYAAQLTGAARDGVNDIFCASIIDKTFEFGGNKLIQQSAFWSLFFNTYPGKDGNWEADLKDLPHDSPLLKPFGGVAPTFSPQGVLVPAMARFVLVCNHDTTTDGPAPTMMSQISDEAVKDLHECLFWLDDHLDLDIFLVRSGLESGQTVPHLHVHAGKSKDGGLLNIHCGRFDWYKEQGLDPALQPSVLSPEYPNSDKAIGPFLANQSYFMEAIRQLGVDPGEFLFARREKDAEIDSWVLARATVVHGECRRILLNT
jgi:hypothetical protein